MLNDNRMSISPNVGALCNYLSRLLASPTYATIRRGLFWAFVYNVVGIPLAATGMLDPMFGGAAMAASSVSVVLNALLLRRWRPGRD